MSSFETGEPIQEVPKSIEGPQAQFQATCFARIDELVAQGIYPLQYAEERKEAARLIEDGLTDPEAQGKAFAEIGMDAIKKFQEIVDETEVEVTTKVEEAIGRLDEIQILLLERKVVPIDMKERLEHVRTTRKLIASLLFEFRERFDSVRSLQAKLSVLTSDEDFRSLLDRMKEEMEGEK